MFKKEFRLPAHARLIQPITVRSSSFLLKFTTNNEDVSRYGFVIGKKKEKRAVARNRIRRRFRACIEQISPEIKPGYDMLFFLERGIIEKKHQDLHQEITVALMVNDIL